MSAIKGSVHNWIHKGSLQWSALGLPPEAAVTTFECSRCGCIFKHYYHVTSDIYKAMAEEGILEECKGEIND